MSLDSLLYVLVEAYSVDDSLKFNLYWTAQVHQFALWVHYFRQRDETYYLGYLNVPNKIPEKHLIR